MYANEQDYIEHYGREGMKWYQHIFGKIQGHAKYAESAADKQYHNYQVKKREYQEKTKPYSDYYKKLENYERLLNNNDGTTSMQKRLDRAEKSYKKSYEAVQEYLKSDKVKEAFDTLLKRSHDKLNKIFAPRKEIRAPGISEKEYQQVSNSIKKSLTDAQKSNFTVFTHTEDGYIYNVLSFGDGTFDIFSKNMTKEKEQELMELNLRTLRMANVI